MISPVTRLTHEGWRETLQPGELLKLYDGFAATITVREPQPGTPAPIVWAVWFTAAQPVQLDVSVSLERAADSVDRAVRKLQRNQCFTTPRLARYSQVLTCAND